jgi:hypothetical protein
MRWEGAGQRVALPDLRRREWVALRLLQTAIDPHAKQDKANRNGNDGESNCRDCGCFLARGTTHVRIQSLVAKEAPSVQHE